MPHKYYFMHERGDYPPLTIEGVAGAWTSCIDKTVGYNGGPAYFIYKDAWVRIYTSESVRQKITDYLFTKISADKNYISDAKKIFDKRIAAILNFIAEMKAMDWQSYSLPELIKIGEQYNNLYYRAVPYGEPLAYYLKEKLEEILENYLRQELKMSAAEYETLLTPLYQSFLSREEEVLRQIAQQNLSQPKFDQKIEQHTQKYKWLLYDYASVIVDKDYFIERAQKFAQEPPESIDYQKLAKQKAAISKKYKLKDPYTHYLHVLEDLFYFMDRKKEVFTKYNYAAIPMREEMASRLGVSFADLGWFFWWEVKDALEKGKIDASVVAKRKENSVIKMHNGKNEYLSNREAKRIREDIDQDQEVGENVKVVKGTPTSSGKIKGVICYLKSARDNSKIKQGEILLVSNTTPDFMPAIQKAAAIVTNEGGLTCHAAIVSRELGIPCVVGTKIATQVFESGDQVEVDAAKGVIKKL
ncbi:MAG: PEP-utilizing enzyme [Parcubacteria group bacterium]